MNKIRVIIDGLIYKVTDYQYRERRVNREIKGVSLGLLPVFPPVGEPVVVDETSPAQLKLVVDVHDPVSYLLQKEFGFDVNLCVDGLEHRLEMDLVYYDSMFDAVQQRSYCILEFIEVI